MTFRSHITLGLIGGIALSYMPKLVPYTQEQIFGLLPLVALGAVFPDVDEPNSFIGKKMPGFSHMVSCLFGHRGFTHFLIFPVLLLLAGIYLFPNCKDYIYAFCFGVFMHQVGDMLTKSGIPSYFFPFSFGFLKHKAVLLPQILRIRTGSSIEMFIVLPLLLITLAFLFWDKYSSVISPHIGRFFHVS
ncbi:hypothetical protein CQA49_06860 [Helicobacter sp. MIT 00-7814]|uniref:metal-dependent hydrolase n=1 Tax=unclassified Helicobacter TaxID=2593540 RepID=UPI000E1F2B56|nr:MULTISPECIES: metal-dependent hydrolase [unclassified Helicobacter]RDU53362.1 hypothetical protein CQA49_06860 [Helicobacter sp. MIT 00-7814]RDU54183.1 hypothetical protein CQA37_06100 [Helicobacter sp. MIT 99-10781]